MKWYESLVYYGSMPLFWGLPFLLKVATKKAIEEKIIDVEEKEKKEDTEAAPLIYSAGTPQYFFNQEINEQVNGSEINEQVDGVDGEIGEECPSCKKLKLVVWQKKCLNCSSVVKLERTRGSSNRPFRR